MSTPPVAGPISSAPSGHIGTEGRTTAGGMYYIAKIPSCHAWIVREAVNKALKQIEGLPDWTQDSTPGHTLITITESVASRHPNQENAA